MPAGGMRSEENCAHCSRTKGTVEIRTRQIWGGHAEWMEIENVEKVAGALGAAPQLKTRSTQATRKDGNRATNRPTLPRSADYRLEVTSRCKKVVWYRCQS